jgi:hypothetical protein
MNKARVIAVIVAFLAISSTNQALAQNTPVGYWQVIFYFQLFPVGDAAYLLLSEQHLEGHLPQLAR